jgi:hypothetical protein
MGDITIYNTDCKTEKDNVHVPGTQELEHKNLGVLEIGSTSLHIPQAIVVGEVHEPYRFIELVRFHNVGVSRSPTFG